MTTTESRPAATLAGPIPEDVLLRCRERAAGYDRANTFFVDDFAELHDLGYLTAPVPTDFGGPGWDLATLAAEQRRLARYAPATALALSMHFYWVGMAADLVRMGDTSQEWILRDVMDGHVFAAGHAEAGNDVPVTMSTATAERVKRGYRYTGRKIFGSLSPVWTRMGLHGLDTSDPDHPTVVHGFITRNSDGFRIVENWDTLGMRATQSHSTVLEGVFVPDERIGHVGRAGDNGDPYAGVMTVWALTLIANVYTGIAERALELAVESATTKTSIAIPQGQYAYNPMVQHQVAEMYLGLDAARATVDRLAADWVAGVDHGPMWGVQVFSGKWRAVETAKRVVDLALDVSGGGAMFRGNELERLYRDVRAGGFHPANDALTHEAIGKGLLGISPDGPRW